MKKNKTLIKISLLLAFVLGSKGIALAQLNSPKFLTVHKADNINDPYGYLGLGSLITGGWSHIPNALTLTYSYRDFAIGGWSKQDGSWHPNNFFINSHTGYVGVNTDGPQYNLDVNGSLRASQIIGPPNGNLILYGQDFGVPGTGYGIELKAVKNGIDFQTYSSGWGSRLHIGENGNVGIGTITPLAKLTVNGNLRATEIRVMTDVSIPDYVFENTYKLRSLSEVASFIKDNKHLPEIPSAAEVKVNGLNVAEMDALLLKKIEELTLYMIELKKSDEAKNLEIESLKKEVEILKTK